MSDYTFYFQPKVRGRNKTAFKAEEAHSTRPHSRAGKFSRESQRYPFSKCCSKISSPSRTAEVQGTADSQGTAEVQGTADFQGTAATQGTIDLPRSPNDYTPTDASQTFGGDEGLFGNLNALNREVRRLKKQTISQAKQIHKLKVKLKKLSKGVEPVVKHHAFWVQRENLKKRRRKQRKKQRKKVSSVKLGRNKDEEAAVTTDVRKKSDEIELKKKRMKQTDEAGPSSRKFVQLKKKSLNEHIKDDELLANILLNRTRGLSIPGPMQSQPQQPTQATDPKEKGKWILVEEPKKKKLTLQQIRALETKNDEEVARKIQAEWDAEEERKRLRQH
ncbi:hypothetical protein Tco_0805454 [Tanacetum coccineum]